MTPMVDVTFLLLIFFMVTAAFSLQKSLEVPKPEQSDQPSTNVQDPEENPDIVTVFVDEFNTFHVSTPEMEREAASQQDLIVRLREARDGAPGSIPSTMLVKVHVEATHNRAVMAMDAGNAVGFEQMQITTVEEDE